MPNLVLTDPSGDDIVLTEFIQGPSGSTTWGVTGTGFVHQTSGVLDAAARAVNLATTDVTGVLAIANGGTNLSAVGPTGSVLGVSGGVYAFLTVLSTSLLPAITLTQDVTGSGAGGSIVTTVVQARAGVFAFGSSGSITWVNSATATLVQPTPTTDIAPTAFMITAQGAWTGASTHVTGANLILQGGAPANSSSNGGDVIVNKTISAGATNAGGFQVQCNNTVLIRMGAYSGTSYGTIWFLDGGAPSASNWSFLGNSGSSYFNAPSSTLYFGIGASYVATITASQFQLGASYLTPQYSFDLSATAKQHFTVNATTATIVYDAVTSDVATALFTIQGQNAFASASTHLTGGSIAIAPGTGATTNGTPGNLNVTLGAASGTGSEAQLAVFRSSDTSPRFAAGTVAALSNRGSAWITNGSNAISNTNYFVSGDGTSFTYFNAPISLGLVLNGATFAQYITANGIQFFLGVNDFGGGTGVIGMTAAATNPTSNPFTEANGILWQNAAGFASGTASLQFRGGNGAITTLANMGSTGTINTQYQGYDWAWGTCRTVSSATATQILAYSTVSGVGGNLQIIVMSRAATAGTGVAVGDTAGNYYMCGFRNISGTVTLATVGIQTYIGSGTGFTTAVALTAPVLTATVATNVITLKVQNVALCTIDSEVMVSVVMC
jgi:hypothetical protein